MAVTETGGAIDPAALFRERVRGRVDPANFRGLRSTGLVDHAVRILCTPADVAAMRLGGNTDEEIREMWRGVFESADRLDYELPGYAEAYRVTFR